MKGYYDKEIEKAKLAEKLIREAMTARLMDGHIKPDELSTYASVLEDAMNRVDYAEKQVQEQNAKKGGSDE